MSRVGLSQRVLDFLRQREALEFLRADLGRGEDHAPAHHARKSQRDPVEFHDLQRLDEFRSASINAAVVQGWGVLMRSRSVIICRRHRARQP